jgi:signal transduction histidine kinase
MTRELWQRLVATVSLIGVTPADDEETRLQKTILLVTTVFIAVAGVVWGLLYLVAGEPLAALIPLAYSGLSTVNLAVLRRTLRFDAFRFTQILMTMLLPFLLMLVLGGFVSGSAVILWALLAPLGALLCGRTDRAIRWFAAFLGLVVLSGLLTPYLSQENNLSNELIIAFYVINIGATSATAFGVLVYFVGQKDLAMRLLQKNRELERAYHKQELMLRQSEKLATLGRLSAGVAHELNNPAAAAQRGAAQLRGAIAQLEQAQFRLGQLRFAEEDLQTLARLNDAAQARAKRPVTLDALARSDREYEVETSLEHAGLDNAWEYAPVLVNMGYESDNVAELAANVAPEQLPTVVGYLSSSHTTHSLLDEIAHGTTRITEIVKALKTYTYLDQAPVQFLDVHEGLDNTLVMLRSKLRKGIDVRREYAADLPTIQGYGSELNQVWTNIIDNAVDAMDGHGNLCVRTRLEEPWVVVEITDSGPGIPDEVAAQIFDPFYTTKAPGEGTGLGLNISRNIVVQKHHGEIAVRSQPGETTFTVKLPLTWEEAEPAA